MGQRFEHFSHCFIMNCVLFLSYFQFQWVLPFVLINIANLFNRQSHLLYIHLFYCHQFKPHCALFDGCQLLITFDPIAYLIRILLEPQPRKSSFENRFAQLSHWFKPIWRRECIYLAMRWFAVVHLLKNLSNDVFSNGKMKKGRDEQKDTMNWLYQQF